MFEIASDCSETPSIQPPLTLSHGLKCFFLHNFTLQTRGNCDHDIIMVSEVKCVTAEKYCFCIANNSHVETDVKSKIGRPRFLEKIKPSNFQQCFDGAEQIFDGSEQ